MFDTNTFVNDFYSILMKYNLNPKEMFKTNEKLYNGKAVDYLNIIEYYTKDKTYYNEINKELSNLYSNIPNYLYPDTIRSLRILKGNPNNKLILITLGEESFQNMKTRNSGYKFNFAQNNLRPTKSNYNESSLYKKNNENIVLTNMNFQPLGTSTLSKTMNFCPPSHRSKSTFSPTASPRCTVNFLRPL